MPNCNFTSSLTNLLARLALLLGMLMQHSTSVWADAKLDDAVIRLLALSGDREILMDNGATSYIERYSAAEWNTWAANGATNMSYDVKDAGGTWHLDLCNGHWNNRGFSTWDDSPYQPCAVPYSGSPRYMTSYHVHSYPNGIGVPFQVSVR